MKERGTWKTEGRNRRRELAEDRRGRGRTGGHLEEGEDAEERVDTEDGDKETRADL